MEKGYERYEDENKNVIEICYAFPIQEKLKEISDTFDFYGNQFTDFLVFENGKICGRYVIDVWNQNERALVSKIMEESLKNRLSAADIGRKLEKASLTEEEQELEKMLERNLKWNNK